ncbi:hypothetical protein TSUD_58040 [Trifolium subterraneum]|uniref:non-specific serine/threonine protein kinase n=1 Tax=Trifolium subterraneum TaxID=3900 RepID=A0A2Z6N4M6_TRISU|nr:hypothetical protein TSUD_58040 [Trifolium subterraneum]
MGGCTSKPQKPNPYALRETETDPTQIPKTPLSPDGENHRRKDDVIAGKKSPFFPFYSPSPARFLKKSPSTTPSRSTSSTPRRFFRRAFPPPSPAKHIRAVLARRQGKKETAAIPEDSEEGAGDLDKRFGFSKDFSSRLEVGEEVGRGHFGYTCSAKFKKGEFKGQQVAVKVIPKAKMTTAIAIEDVRREVKILRALNGHSNLVQFYDAFEDQENVYIVMELCEGGELLDMILSRGGKYTEDDAKAVMVQILNVVAFCHLQGVVHRDLKPENFLYTSKDESSELKAIDFGLSDFVRPEAKDFVQRLLNKDPRKRISAAQALSHPWIRNYNDVKVPLDILIFKLMKTYMRSSSLRKAALRALSKTLTADELYYLREQFALLEPSKNGSISLENINKALKKYATDAMKESRITDFLSSLSSLQYRRMDFEEFCAAALSVHQLEALDRWEQHARCAYELFEKDGNRAIVIEELASELGLGPSIPVHVVLHDWIRHTDGKLSFLGFVKLLHGVSSRSLPKVQL